MLSGNNQTVKNKAILVKSCFFFHRTQRQVEWLFKCVSWLRPSCAVGARHCSFKNKQWWSAPPQLLRLVRGGLWFCWIWSLPCYCMFPAARLCLIKKIIILQSMQSPCVAVLPEQVLNGPVIGLSHFSPLTFTKWSPGNSSSEVLVMIMAERKMVFSFVLKKYYGFIFTVLHIHYSLNVWGFTCLLNFVLMCLMLTMVAFI